MTYPKLTFALATLSILIAGCGGGNGGSSNSNRTDPITFVVPEGATTNANTAPLTGGITSYTTTGNTFTASVTLNTSITGSSRIVSVTIDPSTAVDGIVGLGGSGNTNSALYFENTGSIFGNSWRAISGTVTILKRTGTEIRLRLDGVTMEADPNSTFNNSTGTFLLSGEIRK